MDNEQTLSELLRECSDKVGGKNFFLTLAETIRTTREGIIVGEKKTNQLLQRNNDME